jgi:hypothetical protein
VGVTLEKDFGDPSRRVDVRKNVELRRGDAHSWLRISDRQASWLRAWGEVGERVRGARGQADVGGRGENVGGA